MNLQQFFRFSLIGILTNIVMYLLYLMINSCGVNPKIAMTIVYVFGIFIGFIFHRRWTFVQHGNSMNIKLRYLLVHSLGYSANFFILLFFVDYLHYSHKIIQALAIGIIAVLLFFSLKYFVFKERNKYD
jgi:putative flippase GtrA